MEIRHLRYFLAVAEELHFARAAERLHIETSPLSRAIKELEEELGVALFARTTRSTRLTRAGRLFFESVPRVFAALQQARDSVNAAANGFHCQLRIALSDGITPSRLPALLALCRQEEPEVEVRFFEVPLAQQIKGLCGELYDLGFAQSDEVGEGIIAVPVWSDPLMVAVPARHPLLSHKQIPLEELLRYPLVLCDAVACEGHARQVERVLRRVDIEPLIAERVTSSDLMMVLVSAGLAQASQEARISQPAGNRGGRTADWTFANAHDLSTTAGQRAVRNADSLHGTRSFDQISRCQRSAVNHHTISQRKLTMKKIALILLSSTLAACSPSGKPDKANLPTVDELALNPERLKELRKCKLDRPMLGDQLCNRVAEATRKRFYEDGDVPHTTPKEPPKF